MAQGEQNPAKPRRWLTILATGILLAIGIFSIWLLWRAGYAWWASAGVYLGGVLVLLGACQVIRYVFRRKLRYSLLFLMVVQVLLLIGFWVYCELSPIPIIHYDEELPTRGEFDSNDIGKKTRLCGVLANWRFFEEDPQRQGLICFAAGAPLAEKEILLEPPLLDLPPCHIESGDLPGKNLVGAWLLTGVMAEHPARTGLTRIVMRVEDSLRLDVPDRMYQACRRAVRNNWEAIAEKRTGETSRYLGARIGDFASPGPPVLVGISSDGSQYLFNCGVGTRFSGIHVTWASIHCLVNARNGSVLQIIITSGSFQGE